MAWFTTAGNAPSPDAYILSVLPSSRTFWWSENSLFASINIDMDDGCDSDHIDGLIITVQVYGVSSHWARVYSVFR